MAPVRVVEPAIVTANTEAGKVATSAVTTQYPVLSSSGQTARRSGSIPAPSPARYLLFQVFRI